MEAKKLVSINRKVVLCDSRVVADKFGKKHAYVVRIIQKLTADFKKNKGDLKSPLIKEKTDSYRGKNYVYFEMDKKFFSHLAMRFKGEKAFEWQCKFIDAFFEMEEWILAQKNRVNNLEWKKEREQGKPIRLDLTDEIKTFIEYATNQGSKNAKMYYVTLTKMGYKALGLIEKNEKINKEFRNTLNIMDLHILTSAERVARKALIEGMFQELHYKDIFQLAKQKVIQLADIMLIKPRLT